MALDEAVAAALPVGLKIIPPALGDVGLQDIQRLGARVDVTVDEAEPVGAGRTHERRFDVHRRSLCCAELATSGPGPQAGCAHPLGAAASAAAGQISPWR